jgi:hypothetical protein
MRKSSNISGIYSKMIGMSVVEEGTTGPFANVEEFIEEKKRRLSAQAGTIIKLDPEQK